MPKSGHMANQHAKVCAAAVVAAALGQAPNPAPVLTNTCYSFITDKDVVHVCSVHQYDKEKKTVLPVPGSGGVVVGDERARRPVRVELGEEHLGRHAGVGRGERRASSSPPIVRTLTAVTVAPTTITIQRTTASGTTRASRAPT